MSGFADKARNPCARPSTAHARADALCEGVEALEIEQGLDQALAGGVAVGDGEDVGADGHADGGVARGEIEEMSGG